MRTAARCGLAAGLLAALAGAVRADDVEDDEIPGTVVLAPAVEEPAREGVASWYGGKFHGRLTACGERYDENGLTAAHRTLPFGTRIAVTNLENGCSLTVRVTDRGPYHGTRILDLSRGAAEDLGFLGSGLARVKWEIVSLPAPRSKGLRLGTGRSVENERPVMALPWGRFPRATAVGAQ